MLTKDECRETLKKLRIYATFFADWRTLKIVDNINFLNKLIEENRFYRREVE